MKVLIISIVASFFVLMGEQNYEGKWLYQDSDTSFSLKLQQKDSVVTGSHCSVMLGGNRIDEAFDDEESVKGTVRDKVLFVSIKSGYGLGTGRAKLTPVGQDSLYFEFIEKPEGEYWIPDRVILVKEK